MKLLLETHGMKRKEMEIWKFFFQRIQLCSRNLEDWSKMDFGEITNLL